MQIDLSVALGIGAVVFAAGGAWQQLRSAASQGRRIGALETKVAKLQGMLLAAGGRRRVTQPQGNPIPDVDEGEG